MTKVATNKFTDGLTMDTNPLVTMDTSLSNCLNGTIITFDGNEQTLQNDSGNTLVKDENGNPIQISRYVTEEYQEAKKDENGQDILDDSGNVIMETKTRQVWREYTILGVKEYNGVLYIISKNDNNEFEIGSYPAPVYDEYKDNTLEQSIEIPTDCDNANSFYLDTNEKTKLSVSDDIDISEYKKNIDEINRNNQLVENNTFDFLKIYESNNTSLLWTKIFLHTSGSVFDITNNFINNNKYTIAQLEHGNVYIQIHLNIVEKCIIQSWIANYLLHDNKYNIYAVIKLEHNYITDFLKKCKLVFYNNNNEKLSIKLNEDYITLNDKQIIINTTYSSKEDYQLFDNIQLQYNHNSSTNFKLLNNKYTFLSSSNVLKDGINITGFTYCIENNKLVCTITYSEINLTSNTSFKICYINDLSLQPQLLKEIERSPHLNLITESIQITCNNIWGYILFYANDELIDMQYLIPFAKDIYSQLNYLNFRQDINNPEYYNVGRNIIQRLNTQLETQEEYILHYDSVTNIELNKDRHIIISDNPQTITVSFTPTLKNLAVDLDTYMPDLSASQDQNDYKISYDKADIITDQNNHFSSDFSSGKITYNYLTEPYLFTVNKYKILDDLYISSNYTYSWVCDYVYPEDAERIEFLQGIYKLNGHVMACDYIQYGIYDRQQKKYLFKKQIQLNQTNATINIADCVNNAEFGFIHTDYSEDQRINYLANGKILVWNNLNLLHKYQTENCKVQIFQKLQEATVSGSADGYKITRPYSLLDISLGTSQVSKQSTNNKDIFDVFNNEQYEEYKSDYAHISSIVDGQISFKNEIPDVTQTNEELYCVQYKNIVYNGIQGNFIGVAQDQNNSEKIIGLEHDKSTKFGQFYISNKSFDIPLIQKELKFYQYFISSQPSANPEKDLTIRIDENTFYYASVINTLTVKDQSYYRGILYS